MGESGRAARAWTEVVVSGELLVVVVLGILVVALVALSTAREDFKSTRRDEEAP